MEWLSDRLQEGLDLLDIPLFTLTGTRITLATVVVFVLVVVATFLASSVFQKGLVRALTLRRVTDAGTVEVVRRLLHYVILAVGLAIGLQTIGINLSALFAAGAVFAIGLGFAMQNIAQNFVSGVILLTERSIKPHDVIRVDTRFVRVQTMGIRATIARTLDDEEVIIPNSTIVQATVVNYTLGDSLFRLRAVVGVTYDSDMRLVRETLERTAHEVDWRVDRRPVVLMTGFGDSSVDWEVSVWINDPWEERKARSRLLEAIWWGLKDARVVIAFPQLDVHLDRPALDAISGRLESAG